MSILYSEHTQLLDVPQNTLNNPTSLPFFQLENIHILFLTHAWQNPAALQVCQMLRPLHLTPKATAASVPTVPIPEGLYLSLSCGTFQIGFASPLRGPSLPLSLLGVRDVHRKASGPEVTLCA